MPVYAAAKRGDLPTIKIGKVDPGPLKAGIPIRLLARAGCQVRSSRNGPDELRIHRRGLEQDLATVIRVPANRNFSGSLQHPRIAKQAT